MFRNKSNYRGFGNTSPLSFFQQYRKPLLYGGVGLTAFYVANLEEAPVSRRYRFMVIPRWLELKIGKYTYSQTLREFGRDILPENSSEHRQVQKVMDRLIKVSGIEDVEWKVAVIGGNYPPNAFVLPGGKVFVFTSILPICKTQDGLAAVLGHELAHQVCRHTAENISASPIYLTLAALAFAVTGSTTIERLALETVLKLPASRRMETEADYVGLMLMAKACFRPEAAVGVWERMIEMEQQQGGAPPEFLSTHPASANRITEIQKHLPEAARGFSENCASEFMDFFKLVQ